METITQNSHEGRRHHLMKIRAWWRGSRRWRWGAAAAATLAVAVVVVGVVPLVVIQAAAAKKAASKANDTLIQVNILFRHGERTPREIYPKDPFQKDDWPEGLDQLTLKGKTHMYRLGRNLRELYSELLGVTPHFSSIHMESSAAERCLMSAEAVLAGLMPPMTDMSLHPDLPWQPVPVHHRPPEHDPVLMSLKTCPRFDKMLREAFEAPSTKEIDRQNQKLYDYLTEHTGKPVRNLTDVKVIYDTLVCEKSHGLRLPSWTELVFPKKLQFLSAKARSLNTFNDAMKRLKGGPFFLRLRDRMQQKVKQPHHSTGKMFLYAAHDQTLVDVVRSLGLTDLFEVDFGSCLIFELHQSVSDASAFSISTMYYNTLALMHPKHLSLPGCGKTCSLDTFLRLLEPFIPEDWEKECRLDFKEEDRPPAKKATTTAKVKEKSGAAANTGNQRIGRRSLAKTHSGRR